MTQEGTWFLLTLWLYSHGIDWRRWPIEIDGLPINSMVIFHGELLNNQMVFLSTTKSQQEAVDFHSSIHQAFLRPKSFPTKDIPSRFPLNKICQVDDEIQKVAMNISQGVNKSCIINGWLIARYTRKHAQPTGMKNCWAAVSPLCYLSRLYRILVERVCVFGSNDQCAHMSTLSFHHIPPSYHLTLQLGFVAYVCIYIYIYTYIYIEVSL